MKHIRKIRTAYCTRQGGILFALMLAVTACGNNNTVENRGTIPVSIVNNPRSANGTDTVAAAMKPTMDFQDTMHDFGNIHPNEVVEHDFSFTNNGKSPLIISSAAATCGCTVASYPHDPIPPGTTAVMKVTFNSTGKSGHQEKMVTIHDNTMRYTHMLHIKADIETN